MRVNWSRWMVLWALVSGACTGAPVLAEQAFETLSVAKLPAPTPHRIYVSDVAINHIVDGRLHVIDGDALKYLGVVSTGYAGNATLSVDRQELYVATTYYSRLSRGERAEVVDLSLIHISEPTRPY